MSGLLDRHRRMVIASGLAISVVSALVLIPKIVKPANAAAPVDRGSTTEGFTPVPPGLDWRDASKGFHFVTCFHRPVAQCTIVHGGRPSILLTGDSHAAMLIPALTYIARRDHLTLSVASRGLCPWQRNLYAPPAEVGALIAWAGAKGISQQGCQAFKDDVYRRVLPTLHPDIVVAAEIDYTYINPEATTVRSVRQLARGGRKVVLIEDFPVAPFDPRDCLSKAKELEQCRYVAPPGPTPLELLYRRLASRGHSVYSADFDRLVCPFLPICDPVIRGHIVKWDQTHLTVEFAKFIAPQINEYLKQTVIKSTH